MKASHRIHVSSYCASSRAMIRWRYSARRRSLVGSLVGWAAPWRPSAYPWPPIFRYHIRLAARGHIVSGSMGRELDIIIVMDIVCVLGVCILRSGRGERWRRVSCQICVRAPSGRRWVAGYWVGGGWCFANFELIVCGNTPELIPIPHSVLTMFSLLSLFAATGYACVNCWVLLPTWHCCQAVINVQYRTWFGSCLSSGSLPRGLLLQGVVC